MITVVLSYALAQTAHIDGKIVDVHRHEFAAGRLGRRVVTDLVVEKDGKTSIVHLPAYHTRLGGRPAPQGH